MKTRPRRGLEVEETVTSLENHQPACDENAKASFSVQVVILQVKKVGALFYIEYVCVSVCPHAYAYTYTRVHMRGVIKNDGECLI